MIVINRKACGYCGLCASVCPENAIFLFDTYLQLNQEECIQCLKCVVVCPAKALTHTDSSGATENEK